MRDVDRLATLLDARFRIPGLGVRIGYDSLIGLVPGVGDTLAALPALYIIYRAHRLGASTPTLLRMAANTGVDVLLGTVPVVGDLFDIGFKSNRRNVDLLRRHLMRTPASAADPG